MSTVAIHQPNYLPFYGFFLKIFNSDVFILLDDVQYEKGGFTNRVKIFDYNTKGTLWLTCPLSNYSFGTLIKDVQVQTDIKWKIKHLRTIKQNYFNKKYFDEIFAIITKVYEKNHFRLIDLNVDLIYAVLEYLGNTNTEIGFSSKLGINNKSNERIIEICKYYNASIYLHGKGAQKYHDNVLFEEQNIKLEMIKQDIQYKQDTENFIPNLSIIDMLFNYGKESKNLLRK